MLNLDAGGRGRTPFPDHDPLPISREEFLEGINRLEWLPLVGGIDRICASKLVHEEIFDIACIGPSGRNTWTEVVRGEISEPVFLRQRLSGREFFTVKFKLGSGSQQVTDHATKGGHLYINQGAATPAARDFYVLHLDCVNRYREIATDECKALVLSGMLLGDVVLADRLVSAESCARLIRQAKEPNS